METQSAKINIGGITKSVLHKSRRFIMPPKASTNSKTYNPVILLFMSVFMTTTLALVGYIYNDSRAQAIEFRKENKAMLITLNNRLVSTERDIAVIKSELNLAQVSSYNQTIMP